MAAAENKQLMHEIFDAVANGDRSKFVDHLAEHAVLTVTGENSWSGVYRGKASILRDLFGKVAELAPGARTTRALRFLADDDWVVVEARGDMTTKAGAPYRNHYCLMYRIENGMIVELKEYMDSALCERVLGRYPAERVPA